MLRRLLAAASATAFGIWVIIFDTNRSALVTGTSELSFGPFGGPLTPLASKTTAPRRAADP